ncbi:Fic family protein [Mycolicibacter arupensis]|jgi:Fic family protein|uniref:Cell filamentation protein Fic n=1 Tax=Mycolicibacter arupensis TaxID=342002 RepID=A0A0F5N0P3_9MYCO|nr:Fic family protein [Mycolicibacter arupensis]KAA1429618.1 Fic family protein [Mycolicibacter arupensis]KKC00629.1 cell filamentation protein Fic [Mycolicibacter arupensis]MCV7276756.1 Fic family protein [Mycolicibacter arupensis]OQZ96576.1 cell filamentation protein Fic [Mycolicibacter arupensis]TXI54313.1 MAG: Fic family protein [Mycolicibacter arupensis]
MARGRPTRATVYARLDAAIQELEERLGGLPSPKESEFVWSDIWHLEAHHSTALEGNTLALREVEALLERGRAVGSKPLKEYMEVQGYGVAARWVYSRALSADERHDGTLISISEVSEIHRLAMTPVWDIAPHPDATEREAPGMFREHEIAAFAGGMKPPSWPLVPARLRDWIDLVASRRDDLGRTSSAAVPVPELLAEIHNEFECIHPFIDGNGRTGRLALNLILVRLGYPPVIVLKTQRSNYLAAMQKGDEGDHGPLGEILARAMYDNLNRFIVPSLAGPARLVPLASLADEQFSVAALRQAAVRGRLDAAQGSDGVWRSTRRAVEAYASIKGQHQRGTR